MLLLCIVRDGGGEEEGWREGGWVSSFVKVGGKNAWPVNVRIIEGA